MKKLMTKAERDKWLAKSAEIDYRERVGQMLDSSEIAAGVESVIADFWTETERAVKIDAAEIASDLKLDAERSAKLRSLLLKKNRDMRANFARVCRIAEQRFLSGAEAVA